MSCQYFFSTKGFCWIFLSFVYVNLGIFCAFNNAAFEHMLAQTTTPAQNPLTSVALGQIRLRPQIVASPPPHLPPRIALFLLPPSYRPPWGETTVVLLPLEVEVGSKNVNRIFVSPPPSLIIFMQKRRRKQFTPPWTAGQKLGKKEFELCGFFALR